MKSAALIAALVFTFLLVASAARADDMEGMDMSGGSDSGAVGGMGKHLMMGEHMTMTPARTATSADAAKGEQIIATMRQVLEKYRDSDAAVAAGYIPFMPTVPQDVYHFSSREITGDEYRGDVNIDRPGSLLYEKKTFGGYKLVGAMYSAPPDYTPDQLNAIIPLSLTHWHAHTNICLPPGVTEQDVMNGDIHGHATAAAIPSNPMGFNARHGAQMRFGYMADPRFGFTGTIAAASDCEAVGGTFHPQIFGWMVHVYPFQSDDLKVAFSTEAP
jgi:hypothetical protein